MSVVVVSQPMFLPWIGIFEQLRLADIFVHYDDVQLPRGRSFTTRVQVKTRDGIRWLSVPIDRRQSSSLICDTIISQTVDWQKSHLKSLRHAYARAANFSAMFELAERIFASEAKNIAEFNIQAIEMISERLGLKPKFAKSSELDIDGRGSERLVSICRHLEASVYVTGHGAINYLDHESFERVGIAVRYMNYAAKPWPQLHGDFTPYVTIMDLLSTVHFSQATDHLTSQDIDWKDFLSVPRLGSKIEEMRPGAIK